MCFISQHGPGFIEMPSLDTAKSSKSEIYSLAGCLGTDVGVCNPRPEGWKKVLSLVYLGWKRGGERMIGQCLASLSDRSLTNEIKCAYNVDRCLQALSELGCPPPLLPK